MMRQVFFVSSIIDLAFFSVLTPLWNTNIQALYIRHKGLAPTKLPIDSQILGEQL